MSTTLSFKEWARQKAASETERTRRLKEWTDAYQRLIDEVTRWLREDGEEAVQIDRHRVDLTERGLGTYELTWLRIHVGDESVDVRPLGRNVMGPIDTPDAGPLRPAGRVDVTDRVRKFALYRTIQDDADVWYIFGDSGPAERLTRERFEAILMDLMS